MIHKPSTQLEADLAAKDQLVLQAAEATHHLATVLAAVHRAFWSLPEERLLAVLNADVPTTLATFAANTALATACNANLDALDLPRFSHRAILTTPADITFDGAQFVHTPPPEPEPDPE